MSIRHLDRLLTPRSVAVIGASDRAGSLGATVWRNLRAGRFTGPVWAVNPKHDALDGERVFAHPDELPQPADLAVICTPPHTVCALVDALARRGTRAAVVLAAGMDAAAKDAMLRAARPHLLRVLGPDGLGLLTPHLGLNASRAHTDALPGDVAFVSQSSAVIAAVLDRARSRGVGFSHVIGLGESADVDLGDLLDHLASDARTRAILLYAESFAAPRKLMSAARAAARNKPVIVVKAGRAGGGIQAARAHGGAPAGSDAAADAAIRRAGMLRVDTLQGLFTAAETLARFRGGNGSDGGTLTIMTNGGGAGVMAADAAALAGVPLRVPDESLLARLDALLPAAWSRADPVDILDDAPAQRHAAVLQALLDDAGTGALLFVHAPQAAVRSEDVARACALAARRAAQRLLGCWLGDAAVAEARRIFADAGVADYATPEEAVRAFAMLSTYRRNQAQLQEAPRADESPAPDAAAARRIVEAALAEGRALLDAAESSAVLAAYGIAVTRTLACAPTANAAAEAAQRIGYPVVLKLGSFDPSRSSDDAEGTRADLRSEAELRAAAAALLSHARATRPGARLGGFAVQPHVARPGAIELRIGADVDAVFGPVLLFGAGGDRGCDGDGAGTGAGADTALALPPLNDALARELVSRTRVSALLQQERRGHPPARLEAVCAALVALSQLMADLPEVVRLDVDPLLADADGVLAADARLRVAPAEQPGAQRFAIRPYPAELAETIVWQGRPLLLRPIRPEDEARHRAFAEHLAPEDLRLRFFSVRRELPRSELARLVQIDYAREMAFIALAGSQESGGEDGIGETVGVGRLVADPDNVEAEFAVIVRSDLKGRGLGRLLLDKLIRYARAAGTQRLVGIVLRENAAMRALARSRGFEAQMEPGDGTALRYVLQLQATSAEPMPESTPA